MIYTRQLLFPLAFYKKSKYTGSQNGTNFRLEKATENENDIFVLTMWEAPKCYDKVNEEKRVIRYSFSEEGMNEIVEFLNSL